MAGRPTRPTRIAVYAAGLGCAVLLGSLLPGAAAWARAAPSVLCSIRVSARPHVETRVHGRAARGTWRLSGRADCPSPSVDLDVRADLVRNGVAQGQSLVRSQCAATSGQLCGTLAVAGTSRYPAMSGSWIARVVVFVRGPTSLVTWMDGAYPCVLDTPSFTTICTVTTAVRRLR